MAGGLVGHIYKDRTVTITDCLATGDVLVSDKATVGYGSVVGYGDGTAILSGVYATKESCMKSAGGKLAGLVIPMSEEELEGVFDRNEQYEESNFVIFVLNNEACIVDGENIVDSPYKTPYFGFYLEDDGVPYLDIANMNSGNYHLFVGR